MNPYFYVIYLPMTIALFAPYGLSHPESGLASMLGSHLKTYGHKVESLRCNGILSACGRDSESSFNRTLTSCQSCMSELNGLANWSGTEIQNLSQYLTSDDVVKTQRWIEKLPREELLQASYSGLPLAELSRNSISERIPERRIGASQEPDVNNRSTEHIMRRIILQASRVELVFQRYLKARRPTHTILIESNDFVSSVAIATTGLFKSERIILQLDQATHNIKVRSRLLDANEELLLPVLFDNVTKLRSDYRTWPKELVCLLDHTLVELGLANQQIALNLS